MQRVNDRHCSSAQAKGSILRGEREGERVIVSLLVGKTQTERERAKFKLVGCVLVARIAEPASGCSLLDRYLCQTGPQNATPPGPDPDEHH